MDKKYESREMTAKGYNTKGPTPGEITISASTPILNAAKGIPLEDLKTLKSCGFNGCLGLIEEDDNDEYITATLANCKTAGMSLIWRCNSLWAPTKEWIKNALNKASNPTTDEGKIKVLKEAYTKRIKDVVEKFDANEYLGGWLFKDEPTIAELEEKFDPDKETLGNFDTPEGSFYSISNRYSLILQYSPSANKVILENLVGEPSGKHTGTATEECFNKYLDAFGNIGGDEFKPYLWCFDYYPILEKNALLSGNVGVVSNNGVITVSYQRFYTDLDTFRTRAKACGGIFWYYVQSMAYAIGGYYHPRALENYLRFEIFSALALGAQGIIYWTYHQRYNSTELYLSALIDMNDKKTAAWYYAQKVNQEVQHFNFVFFDAVCEARAHVGEIYPGCPILNYTLGPIGIRIEAEGKGVLASYLTKVVKENGVNVTHRYIVIVSHDIENYQDIKIFFNPVTYVIKELTPLHSDNPYPDSIIDIPTTGLERTLLPGGYLIYEWNVQV